MRRPGFKLSCDLCGGPGVGGNSANAAAWTPGCMVVHADPRVCASYLAEKAQKEVAQ